MLPLLNKNWQFQVNQNHNLGSNVNENAANLFIAIKNSLLGLGQWTNPSGVTEASSGGWEVVQSNGRISGLSGVGIDVLINSSEVIWATSGNRFWIILENQDGAQIMFGSPNTTTYSTIIFQVSPSAGFTGGTATTLPTATDSSPVTWTWGCRTTLLRHKFHVMRATDGHSFRVLIANQGAASGTWLFDRILNPKPGLTLPYTFGISGIATAGNHNVATSGGFFSGTSGGLRFWHSGSIRTASLTAESLGVSQLGLNDASGLNNFDKSWYIGNLGIWGHTAGARGSLGNPNDLWVGPANKFNGDGFPNFTSGPANQFVSFNGLLFPWNQRPMIVDV